MNQVLINQLATKPTQLGSGSMPFIIPNEGEVKLISELLSSGENWTLDLIKDSLTPIETDIASTHTKVTTSDWPGYSSITLTRSISGSTWNTPTSNAPTNIWSGETLVAESIYGSSSIVYTNNHSTNIITVYGYQIVGVTSGKLIGCEQFVAPRVLNPNDQLQLIPRFGLS